ncbi:MAG: aminotransferase class V-fold PLP-dependent enzyme, partial [Victivallales bacterium]|nr:aminotransferase class V-fold PLP-dependent enzyme [Victivallales bacterium]
VPFIAMGGVYEQDDIDAVTRVTAAAGEPGGDFFPLPEENDFQNGLAEHEGAKKAIAVNSCGTALDCCMMALGIGPGDEVITTAHTYWATAAAVLHHQAIPVFVDVDPATYCIDPGLIEERITAHTRAIIPVHIHGMPCDMDAILDIAERHGLQVIEDVAQAHGSRHRD